MRIVVRTVLSLFCLLMMIGCQQPPPQQGLWKGTLVLAEQKPLPFLLYLDLKAQAPSGYFSNGSERTPIPEIYYRGDSLIFVFSEYGSVMYAVWKNGRLNGEYLRFRKDTVVNMFEAIPYRADEEAPKAKTAHDVPLVGKFQAYIKNGTDVDSSSAATFWARGDSIFGTMIAPDGDYGLMAGKQIGNSVLLGRFNGWQGQLMELTRDQNRWSGTLYYRMPPPVTFTLEPRATLPTEPPAAKRILMKDPRKPFAFSGITVMGDTLTHLDTRFRGKGLIIDIMGTWCHNCMDATPLLQRLYSEFGGRGLEIIGLSFEIRDDLQIARKNLLLFEERYGVTFPVLFCGSTESANVDIRLRTQLNNFSAYPTTIFVDRKGVVQYVHEGFKGPGTGEEYQSQVDLYYSLVQNLLKGKTASH